MANEQNSPKLNSNAEEGKGKGKSNQAVVDYLQAPRKKRKSYVVVAVGDNIDADLAAVIQRFLKTNYVKLTVVVARNVEDFLKYSGRNIVLCIIDDELVAREQTLELIKKLKEQKNDGPIPTLFLTKNSAELLDSYRKILSLYHEVDEYVNIIESPRHAIFNKIKHGLENKNQRRARRYKVSLPVYFQILDSGEEKFTGEILDFSIYGALLKCDNEKHHFTTKDQLLIHLPVSQILKGHPDIIRFSARVRRVLISGAQAGISWEYLSDDKTTIITGLLTSIVDQALLKTANSTRARIARVQAEQQLTRAAPKPPV